MLPVDKEYALQRFVVAWKSFFFFFFFFLAGGGGEVK